MHKIFDLAFVAAATLAVSAPALADSKSAAEFALATCLAAMDDLAKVEVLARGDNWLALPSRPPTDPKLFKSKKRWMFIYGEDKFFVSTWIDEINGNIPICFVGLGKNVNRDEFFNAISASVELKFLSSDTRFPPLRLEEYDIKSDGPSKVQLLIAESNGTMSSVMFHKVMPQATPALPEVDR